MKRTSFVFALKSNVDIRVNIFAATIGEAWIILKGLVSDVNEWMVEP